MRREFSDVDDEIAYLTSKPLRGEVMGGAHEAADRFDRSLATWSPVVQHVDADVLPDRMAAEGRSRDMVRNDSFVSNSVGLHRDNIVGSLYALNAAPNVALLRRQNSAMDETWATEFQEEVEALFTLWAESPRCWADAAEKNSLTEMIRLAVAVYLVSGEFLMTGEWARENSGRPFQTMVQAVEVDRLCDPMDRPHDLQNVRGGVRFNSYGAPQGYYIRRSSNGLLNYAREAWTWSYIRAFKSWGRPQVLHVLEQSRPGQTRGIGQMVSALKEMRVTKRFRDITLQNAVVNASFAAAIESELPTEAVFAAMGAGEDPADAYAGYAANFLSAVSAYSGNARNLMLDGVRIPHLMPGTKLNLLPMGKPGGVGTEFEDSLLRYAAAGLGVSYEELSKNFSKSNYSAARAATLETRKFMGSRKRIVADRTANFIYGLWLEEAMNSGSITSMPRSAPDFYEGLNREAYSTATWIGAGQGMIDELKETQAAILRLKSGLSTYEAELARQGRDWRAVMAQQKREKELQEKYGIEPQEANAVNAASGDPREKSAAGASEGGDDE